MAYNAKQKQVFSECIQKAASRRSHFSSATEARDHFKRAVSRCHAQAQKHPGWKVEERRMIQQGYSKQEADRILGANYWHGRG